VCSTVRIDWGGNNMLITREEFQSVMVIMVVVVVGNVPMMIMVVFCVCVSLLRACRRMWRH